MGHRKHIVPNKRQMIPHFLNGTMSPEEFGETIRALHGDGVANSEQRSVSGFKDVLRYPFPECMCQQQQQPQQPKNPSRDSLQDHISG